MKYLQFKRKETEMGKNKISAVGCSVMLPGNASMEDLDEFTKQFFNTEEDKDQEGKDDTGGQQGQEEVTGTMATTRGTTERSKIEIRSVASLPVSLVRMTY